MNKKNFRYYFATLACVLTALIIFASCAPAGYVSTFFPVEGKAEVQEPSAAKPQDNTEEPTADIKPDNQPENTAKPKTEEVNELEATVTQTADASETEVAFAEETETLTTITNTKAIENSPPLDRAVIANIPPANEDEYTLIQGVKILPMAGDIIDNGDILLKGSKIYEIGKNIEPPGEAQIYTARGMWALPGLVDAHSHLGLIQDNSHETDYNELPFGGAHPSLRAIDAVDPFAYQFVEAYRNGVTTVATGPGSGNIMGGQFAAIKTYGYCVDDMIIDSYVAQKVALGENPKLSGTPATRMGVADILRKTLERARQYVKNKGTGDLDLDALVPVLQKKIPLKVHAHKANDILTAIRIAKEFDINITLDHATEASMVLDKIAESGFDVILGPTLTARTKEELSNMSYDTYAKVSNAGIRFAIATDDNIIPEQYLRTCAALAVANGLDEAEAMRAITIYPAQILGIDDRVGSIEKGKDADIVLYDGNPLEHKTNAKMVFINGALIYSKD